MLTPRRCRPRVCKEWDTVCIVAIQQVRRLGACPVPRDEQWLGRALYLHGGAVGRLEGSRLVATLLALAQRRILLPERQQTRQLGKELLAVELGVVDLYGRRAVRLAVGAEPKEFVWSKRAGDEPGFSRVRSRTTPIVSARRLGECSVLAA